MILHEHQRWNANSAATGTVISFWTFDLSTVFHSISYTVLTNWLNIIKPGLLPESIWISLELLPGKAPAIGLYCRENVQRLGLQFPKGLRDGGVFQVLGRLSRWTIWLKWGFVTLTFALSFCILIVQVCFWQLWWMCSPSRLHVVCWVGIQPMHWPWASHEASAAYANAPTFVGLDDAGATVTPSSLMGIVSAKSLRSDERKKSNEQIRKSPQETRKSYKVKMFFLVLLRWWWCSSCSVALGHWDGLLFFFIPQNAAQCLVSRTYGWANLARKGRRHKRRAVSLRWRNFMFVYECLTRLWYILHLLDPYIDLDICCAVNVPSRQNNWRVCHLWHLSGLCCQVLKQMWGTAKWPPSGKGPNPANDNLSPMTGLDFCLCQMASCFAWSSLVQHGSTIFNPLLLPPSMVHVENFGVSWSPDNLGEQWKSVDVDVQRKIVYITWEVPSWINSESTVSRRIISDFFGAPGMRFGFGLVAFVTCSWLGLMVGMRPGPRSSTSEREMERW